VNEPKQPSGERPPIVLHPIGWVESSLTDRKQAPKQGDEGSPDAWLVFDAAMSDGLRDLRVGTDVIVLTWLDRARRDVLRVHPRDDPRRSETGVFSTRSPDRPNPIGLHRVVIVAINGPRVRVRNLEALHGTPIVDVKPVLDPGSER
jgi:tRNA-Thr(GGU) m(6)t(6)A37 methyltransferase TsaA